MQQQSFRSTDLTHFIRQKLTSLFHNHFPPQSKCLYIQHNILQRLNFLFELKFSEFQQSHRITTMYEFSFDDTDTEHEDESKESTVVFFLSASVSNMRRIATMVLANRSRNVKKDYFVLLSPKKTFLCLDELETLGVFNSVKVFSFNFGLMPLEPDLLSLELDRPFYELYVRKNQNMLHLVAEEILKLHSALGTFEHLYAKGDNALVKDLVTQDIIDIVRAKYSDQKFEKRQSQYEISLFVFDRTCDLVTPMLTPYSYQGLLDVLYPIELNQITVPGQLLNQKQNQPTPYLIVNPLDETYPLVRHMYINYAVAFMRDRCKTLKDQIKQLRSNDKLTLQQLNELNNSKVRQYVFAQNHTSLCLDLTSAMSKISFYNKVSMETAMLLTGANALDSLQQLSVFNSPDNFLRLISLASSMLGGIKQKTLKGIQQTVIRAYGMQHCLTIKNMHIAGLLQNYVNRGNWNEIKKQFELIDESVDLEHPKNYAYIFIIYASLIVKMVEEALNSTQAWSNNKEKYALVKGGTVYYRQKESEFPKSGRPKMVFVFFVGGVTYPEVESLRFLSRMTKREIIICSTHITNGNGLIKECFQGAD